jgi:hypothetical protein
MPPSSHRHQHAYSSCVTHTLGLTQKLVGWSACLAVWRPGRDQHPEAHLLQAAKHHSGECGGAYWGDKVLGHGQTRGGHVSCLAWITLIIMIVTP